MTATSTTLPHHRRSLTQGLWRHAGWPLRAALCLTALLVLTAILAPWISPHDPLAINLPARLAPPDARHWLGTDHLGRDILSRLMAGA